MQLRDNHEVTIIAVSVEDDICCVQVDKIPDITYIELKDGSYYGTDEFGLQHRLLRKSRTEGAFKNKPIVINTITGIKKLEKYWWDSTMPVSIYKNTVSCKLIAESFKKQIVIEVDKELLIPGTVLNPRKSPFLNNLSDEDYNACFANFKKEVL